VPSLPHQNVIFPPGVVLLLLRVVAAKRSDAHRNLGLSLGSQQLHCVVFTMRLFFKIYDEELL
jgi:hypothetical protein